MTLLAFGGLIARAAYLQTVAAAHLTNLARGQQVQTLPLPATRGNLFDRYGRALALSEPGVTIAAYTHEVRSPDLLATRLAPILHLPASLLAQRLGNRSVDYAYLAREESPSVWEQMKRAHIDISALSAIPEQRRTYPQGTLGAQVIGTAGINGNGIAGAELSLDPLLRAAPGSERIVHDPSDHTLRVLSRRAGHSGNDVTLTMDRDIQKVVEQAAADVREQYHARAATILVLDPRTSGILGMASAPGVPAGGFGSFSASTADDFKLRAITEQYEPGSTFKVVTIGASLDLGIVSPYTDFTVPSCITRYQKVVCDAEDHPTETMSVTKILQNSSNVGTITLAWKVLGEERLSQWIDRLQFGKVTGVDLPGELPGSVPQYQDTKAWSGTSILNLPIGLGVAVTPLQMAALYAAIADGGVWHQPHIVQHVVGGATPAVRQWRAFRTSTAADLDTMLRDVVSDGTGLKAQIANYTVAGKTGTTPKLKNGQYCHNTCALYDASFVGYLPASNPRAVVLVVVDEPDAKVGYYGGDVAAPTFAKVGLSVMQIMGVPPDKTGTATTG